MNLSLLLKLACTIKVDSESEPKQKLLSGRATAEFNIFGWQVELECVSKLNCLKEIE